MKTMIRKIAERKTEGKKGEDTTRSEEKGKDTRRETGYATVYFSMTVDGAL